MGSRLWPRIYNSPSELIANEHWPNLVSFLLTQSVQFEKEHSVVSYYDRRAQSTYMFSKVP
jgi:hypothetical protein